MSYNLPSNNRLLNHVQKELNKKKSCSQNTENWQMKNVIIDMLQMMKNAPRRGK